MTVDVTAVQDAPTAANKTVTTNEDTDYTFTTADFNFSDVDAGDSLTQVQITTLETVGSLELSGAAVTLNQVITAADISAGNLKFVPVGNANGAGYDNFQFKVHDGIAYSASAYTMTVDVTAVANPDPIEAPIEEVTPPTVEPAPEVELETEEPSTPEPEETIEEASDTTEDKEVITEEATESSDNAALGTSLFGNLTVFINDMDHIATTNGVNTPVEITNNETMAAAYKYAPKPDSYVLKQVFASMKLSAEMTSSLDMWEDSCRKENAFDEYNLSLTSSTAAASAVSLSVIASSWALRGGSLLASLLSTVPAWMAFDPLPILSVKSGKLNTDAKDEIDELFEKDRDAKEQQKKPNPQ